MFLCNHMCLHDQPLRKYLYPRMAAICLLSVLLPTMLAQAPGGAKLPRFFARDEDGSSVPYVRDDKTVSVTEKGVQQTTNALKRLVRLKAQGIALAEVLKQLETLGGVPIKFDSKDAQLATAAPMPISVVIEKPVSLRDAFERVLIPLGLTIVVEEDGVRVSSLNPVPNVNVQSDESWSGRSVEHEGAVLWVLIPEVVTADSIPIHVILVNDGFRDFLCGDTGYLIDCKVNLVDMGGQRVAYTRHGLSLFFAQDRDQFAFPKFVHGESRRWKYNLAKAFDPLNPGKYVLSLEAVVSFKDPKTNEFSSKVQLVAKGLIVKVKRGD